MVWRLCGITSDGQRRSEAVAHRETQPERAWWNRVDQFVQSARPGPLTKIPA